MSYPHFEGNWEEVLKTYQYIPGGHFENLNRYDNPNRKAPEEPPNAMR